MTDDIKTLEKLSQSVRESRVPEQPELSQDQVTQLASEHTFNRAMGLRSTLLSNKDKDPKRHAEARRLQQEEKNKGIPQRYIADDLERYRDDKEADVDLVKHIASNYPQFDDWMKNEDNVSLAHNDVSGLTSVMDLARSAPGGTVRTFSDLLSGTGGVAKQLGAEMQQTRDARQDTGLISDINSVMDSVAPTALQGFGHIADSSGRGLRYITEEYIKPPEERRNFATQVASGLGQMAGQLGAYALNPALGTATLASMGAAEQQRRLDRAGIEDSGKRLAAMGYGAAATYLTERAALGVVGRGLNRMGISGTKARNLFGDDVQKFFDRIPQFRKSKWLDRTIDVGSAAGAEAAQESLDGAIQDTIEYGIYNPDVQMFKDLQREAAVGGTVGGIARAALRGIAGGRHMQSQVEKGMQSDEARAHYKEVSKNVSERELNQNAPDKMDEILQMSDLEDQEIRLDNSVLERFNQDDIDREAFFEKVPEARPEFENAEISGSDISLPAHRLIGATAKDQNGDMDFIYDFIKADPDGPSANEYDRIKNDPAYREEKVQEVMESLKQDEQFQAENEAQEEFYSQVHRQIRDNLIDPQRMGEKVQDANSAEAMATAISSSVRALSSKGEAADRIVRQMFGENFVIRGPQRDKRPPTLPTGHENVFIDEIRRYKQKQDRRARNLFTGKKKNRTPKPIMDYIANRGKIARDSKIAGELKASGVTPREFPKLFHRKGTVGDLDNIPAQEIEESIGVAEKQPFSRDINGYADRDEIIQAISDEAAGNYIPSMDEEAEAQNEAYYDEIVEVLEDRGVDVINASNREIKDALDAAEAEFSEDSGPNSFDAYTTNLDPVAMATDTTDAAQDLQEKVDQVRDDVVSPERQDVVEEQAEDIPFESVAEAAPRQLEMAEEGVSQEQGDTEAGQDQGTAQQEIETSSPVIEDFGEKIEGARKEVYQQYQEKLSKELPDDFKDITLSKHFPAPDLEKLIEAGVTTDQLAIVKAIRDQIGNKPRKQGKLKVWAAHVKESRQIADEVIQGEITPEEAIQKVNQSRNIPKANKAASDIRLYRELGYPAFNKVDGHAIVKTQVRRDPESARMERMDEPKHVIMHKDKFHGETYDSYEQALEALRQKLEVRPDTGSTKKTKLDIYQYKSTGEIAIGKRMGSRKNLDVKSGFQTAQEAQQYLRDNEDALLVMLEEKKKMPALRRQDNEDRMAQDVRLNENVTPEKFARDFGFRGVQFGNYVEQRKRVEDLNNTYDSLYDLASTIGIPSRAVSLNGRLGLAFGARGKGGKDAPKAHYEPQEVVINLTKKEGAGSLGHEWWHALDNYFGRQIRSADYVTERRARDVGDMRPEVAEAFSGVMSAINKTNLRARSEQLDKKRTKDYFSTDIELSARAFESYLVHKAEQRGERNDYLANIVREEAFEDDPQTYPYPTQEEMENEIAPAFDNLFETLETRETDQGVELFQVNEYMERAPYDEAQENARVQEIARKQLGEYSKFDSISSYVETDSGIRQRKVSQPFILPAITDRVDGRIGVSTDGTLYEGQGTRDNPMRPVSNERRQEIEDVVADEYKKTRSKVDEYYRQYEQAARNLATYADDQVDGDIDVVHPGDTESRYVTFNHGGKTWKIRFSNHMQPVEGNRVVGGFSRERGERFPSADLSIDPSTGITEDSARAFIDDIVAGNVEKIDQPTPQQMEERHSAYREKSDFYFQDKEGPRGSFEIRADGRRMINLFENADSSTIIHETGHMLLDAMDRISREPDAPQQVVDDYNAVLKWMGVESGDQVGRKQHEEFARGFEAYLFEGKSPSRELESTFDRFKMWLIQVYNNIRNLNITLNDEVRGVFDRLLATDAEIENYRNHPLASAEQQTLEMLTKAEREKYMKQKDRAMRDAKDKLFRKALREKRREGKQWWKEERQRVREETEAQMQNEGMWQAINFMKTGKDFQGNEIADGAHKMNDKDIVNIYGSREVLKYMPRGTRTKEEGVDIRVLADMYGFAGAHEMLETIASQQRTYSQEIEHRVDDYMIENYGDMLNDGTIEQQALEQVMQESSSLDMTILEWLGGKTGAEYPSDGDFKESARRVINELSVEQATRPGRYFNAAMKAEREYGKAIGKQDFEAAAEAKRRVILNKNLYRMARDNREEVTKSIKNMKKLTKTPRKREKREKYSIDPDYHNKIKEVLSHYNLGPRMSDGKRKRLERQALEDWIYRQQFDEGADIQLPAELIEADHKTHYRDLTMGEFRGLRDFIKNLETQGRQKQHFYSEGMKQEMNSLVGELAETAAQHNEERAKPVNEARQSREFGYKARDVTVALDAITTKVYSLMQQLDGGDPDGKWTNTIYVPIRDAEVQKNKRAREELETFRGIFEKHYSDESRDAVKVLSDTFKQRGQAFDFLAESYTITDGNVSETLAFEDIISIGLHQGTEGNRVKLLDGYEKHRGWSQGMIDNALSKMRKKDWDFVQDMWDYMDSFWPELKAIEERRLGYAPEKVEAAPFTVETKDGQTVTLRGGYFPINYDTNQEAKPHNQVLEEEYENLVSGQGGRAMTSRGMAEERVSGVQRPIRLDLDVIPEHMNELITYIHMGEAIENAAKILRREDIRDTISTYLGKHRLDQIDLWLRDVASGGKLAGGTINRLWRTIRQNYTIGRLGFSFKTAMIQFSGIAQVNADLGSKYTARGLQSMMSYGNPYKALEDIQARSDFMDQRKFIITRDMSDVLKSYTDENASFTQKVSAASMWMMQRTQGLVDGTAWLGAYYHAIDNGKSEQEAIKLADNTVARSQGSGLVSDMAGIERGTLNQSSQRQEFIKAMTMFYTYFNAKYNLVRNKNIQYKNNEISTLQLANSYLNTFVIEAMLSNFIMGQLDLSEEDDDEITPFSAITSVAWMTAAQGGSSIPFVRTAFSAAEGFGTETAARGQMGTLGTQMTRGLDMLRSAVKGEEIDRSGYAFVRGSVDIANLFAPLPASQVNQILRGMERAQDPNKDAKLIDFFLYRED